MPGKVLDVLVENGQEVEAGATLVLLEAMKMELRITAPQAGTVQHVFVEPGEIVDQGQSLVEIA
jgi:biotin carboxyl carrier protein